MNIIISGGTGFVGQHLTKVLNEKGHHVFILTRSPYKHHNTDQKTFIDYEHDPNNLKDIHAIINLAGASLFGYWTQAKKEAILNSRLNTTKKLIHLIKQLPTKPKVFINGSAIGYYGTSNETMFTEKTTQSGNDFLADVAIRWENCAKEVEKMGIRTVYTRFGVILGKESGALPFMAIPVQLFVGGKIGDGEQWLSWIHIDDVTHLITFCMDNEHIEGPINVTAPQPLRNKDFMKVLAKALKRPYWFPTPAALLKVALGEMSMLITKGQYVIPKKAEAHQYSFIFPDLERALTHIYHK